MTTITHTSVSIAYIEKRNRALRAKGEDGLYSDGALRYWGEKGYKYVPACDNVDATGHCAGHETADERRERERKEENIAEAMSDTEEQP